MAYKGLAGIGVWYNETAQTSRNKFADTLQYLAEHCHKADVRSGLSVPNKNKKHCMPPGKPCRNVARSFKWGHK